MVIEEFSGQYRFLSNFYNSEVFLDGEKYPTVENAYQAAKTLDPNKRKEFQNIFPDEAKRCGRKVDIRKDWEDVKIEVMKSLLVQKFSKEPLKSKLKETSPAELIEGNWWNDTFWGVCNGIGKNNLGKLLMKIRGTI